MEDNIQILDEFNKVIKMGEDSYAMVIEKATDLEFKNLLEEQSNAYEAFLTHLNTIYKELGITPADTKISQKFMGWTGIQMNTLTDTSNSHLSEMLIQGTTMGIISCTKILNTNPNIKSSLKSMIHSFIDLQTRIANQLQPFLFLTN
ncbi:MAG: hypothetical protein RSE00_03215 [Clostridia bacterium]